MAKDCRTWSGWAQHATGIGGNPVPILCTDGRITAVYRGSNGAAWQVSQSSVANDTWSQAGSIDNQLYYVSQTDL
jgi:hypothetical protein